MMRILCSKLTASSIAWLAIVACASQADAGWRWHGSSGGSWGGSWGSYGGSFGSSGGSWGWHHHRWHRHWHASWGGSYGSWGGSWGGSSGGYFGSSGGSSGGWGSSGGSYYAPMEAVPDASTPAPTAPTPGTTPAPAPAPAPAAPAPGTSTSYRSLDGLLTVSVPEDARIYVNGQPTTSTGSLRQYVSRDLQSGFNYTYEVRAEVVRDGRTIEQVKKVDLRAGETAQLAFDFPLSEATETSLTVHVPADAKVYLAGNATKATGETRVFRTTGLPSGKSWDGYTVRVEVERGGRVLTREQTISLKAGQSQELRFDFDGDKVASAR